MILQNLHMHSLWDDGQNSTDEMVRAAIAAGLISVGFSGHSPVPFPAEWTIAKEDLPAYRAEVRRLQETYTGRIDIFCGLEWDLLSETDFADCDYVIGSIHHIPLESETINVDNSPEETKRYLSACFGGDADAAAKAFFAQYGALAEIAEIDIIGHFDLITKFDERHHFFDAESPVYTSAALEAMEALVKKDKIFEINTGAISRGYRTTPYPSRELLTMLKKMGGRITISSDAHTADGVACSFGPAEELALSCGFKEIWNLDGKKFVPAGIGERK